MSYSPQGIKLYRAIGQSRFWFFVFLNCFVTCILISWSVSMIWKTITGQRLLYNLFSNLALTQWQLWWPSTVDRCCLSSPSTFLLMIFISKIIHPLSGLPSVPAETWRRSWHWHCSYQSLSCGYDGWRGCLILPMKSNIDVDILMMIMIFDNQVLIGDSNTGWTSGQALRVANAVKDIDVFIEQPCPTYRYIMVIEQ